MGNSKTQDFVYSVAVDNSEEPGFSSIYQNKIMHFVNECATYLELFLQISYKFPSRPFLGYLSKKGLKVWTYEQSRARVHEYIRFLSDLELHRNSPGLCLVGLICKSSPKWILFELACMSLSITTVGLHNHRGINENLSIMNQVGLKHLVCDSDKSLSFIKAKKLGLLPELEDLIVFGRLSAGEKKLKIENFKVTQVKLLKNIEVCVKFPQSDSIFTLALTSGTGGKARVLKVTQSNLMCSIIGTVNNGYDWGPDDTYFSYIPLSIPMERFCLYAISKTMTKIILSSGNLPSLPQEFLSVKPTIIISVPDMLEEIYKNVMIEMNKLTGLRRTLAFRALKSKLETLDSTGQVSHKLFDSLVFKKIRESLGGRLRQIVTGSYHVFPLVIKHVKVFFSCHVIEGYGVVEANTCNVASWPGDPVSGHQGGPMSSLEARLRLVPALGSLFDGPVGELCLRGEIVCKNYWDGSEVCDQQGWLRTGDIFHIKDKGAAFELVERADCLVLVKGCLVALGKLEAVFRCSLLVKQIFIEKNLNDELVAVVVPCDRIFHQVVEKESQKTLELDIAERIRIDLDALAERAGLDSNVRVKKVFVEMEPWKSDEVLTVTMKIIRPALREKYKDLLGI